MRKMGDWHEYLMKRLAEPENAMNYLDVSLEEYQVDGGPSFFLMGIQNVVEAQGGVSTFAEQIGFDQEVLLEMLSNDAAPCLDTLNAIVKALGCRLTIKPREAASPDQDVENEDYPFAPQEAAPSNISATTD